MMELNTETDHGSLPFLIKASTIIIIVTSLYYYYTKTFNFFAKKGIPFMKPKIFLGNLGARLLAKKAFHDFQLDIYNYFKGNPYGGVFEGRRPVLYVLDPDIIKAVTIRDFDSFVDRNTLNSREPGYLRRSLLNLKGNDWKSVRSTLTPAFSSARLKNMLPLIQLCTDQMVKFLQQYDNKDIEMKDIMGHFTLEVIGACAFGIKCDSLQDENSHFLKVAKKFNYMSKSKRAMIFFLLMFMPSLFKYFNISFMNPETSEELVRMLKIAKAERRSSGTKKSDFLQLLIDAAEKEKQSEESKVSGTCLDDDTIDAQSLLFLIAGYETSSTLLSFATHVLATKPELQTKLRNDIVEKTRGREMSYDLLSELTYLDGFLLETLRMYPPVARVDRICTKKYTLPGTSIQFNVGDVFAIPVYGIHMDPTYYPDPKEFKPERFMNEEKKERPSHLFLAFGSGPRNCIGLRFAMFSAKLAMVELLKNYKFSVCDKTNDPVIFEKRGILLQADLWVHIEAFCREMT